MTAGPGATELLTSAQLVDRLRSPRLAEEFSALTGEPLLAVDLEREGRALTDEAVAAARQALARLPCPLRCKIRIKPNASHLGCRD